MEDEMCECGDLPADECMCDYLEPSAHILLDERVRYLAEQWREADDSD